MRINGKLNSNLELGLSMSRASYAIESSNRKIENQIGSVAIRNLQFPMLQLEMESEISQLKNVSKKCQNPFERLFRSLLNLFGIVTNYQKLMNEINILECNANLIEREHLKQLEKEKTGALDNIEAALTEISDQFTAVEEEIQNLDTPADLALYQKHLKSMEEPLNELFKIYRGDAPQLKLIKELADRYDKVLNELSKTVPPQLPGGIRNGGNTCYLASAMQAINNVPEYRDLFKNPLQQRPGESEESLEERKRIQKAGFTILQKIERRKEVSREEINLLRQACYEHKEDDIRVIKSLGGQTDSMETLGRLLSALDYQETEIQFIYEDTVDVNGLEIVDDGKERDVSKLKDVKKYVRKDPFILYTDPHKEKNVSKVSMDTLIQDLWKVEYVEESRLLRKRSVNPDNLPNVLLVKVVYSRKKKMKITNPETVHISGYKYRLAAVIEHMPGHYVAHVVKPSGMFTANDSRVRPQSNSFISGDGYIYVMDGSAKLPTTNN